MSARRTDSPTAAARRAVFWTLDRARGGRIAAAVAEVQALMGDPRSPWVREARRARLAAAVRHAVERTDFYAGLPVDDLASLPVVDKATFRQHGAAMLARGFERSALVPHRTSGSTGTPFESLWDAHKGMRNFADTIALGARAGYRIGSPLLYLRAWGGQHGKGRLRSLREGLTPIEVRTLDAARARELMLGIRRRRHPVTLLGYGSAIEELCRFADETGLDARGRVAGVVAVGEAPTSYLREASPRAFGRPLVARYSNTENGLIAQTDAGEEAYRVNVAAYHVEILRHGSDEATAPGEQGRIVLTDLHNRAMPFLRYDTGDVGAFGVDEDGEVDDTVLASVGGRTFDRLYDTRGRAVHPLVTPELADYDLRQFQIVQTGAGRYVLRINADRDAARDARIRAEFLEVLGADADVRFEHVEEVPLLASGKRRMILSEWRPAE